MILRMVKLPILQFLFRVTGRFFVFIFTKTNVQFLVRITHAYLLSDFNSILENWFAYVMYALNIDLTLARLALEIIMNINCICCALRRTVCNNPLRKDVYNNSIRRKGLAGARARQRKNGERERYNTHSTDNHSEMTFQLDYYCKTITGKLVQQIIELIKSFLCKRENCIRQSNASTSTYIYMISVE